VDRSLVVTTGVRLNAINPEDVMKLFLTMVITFGSGSVAYADSPRQIDIERHRECMQVNATSLTDCFDHVSSFCEEEEAAQPQARMWCDLREYSLWLETSDLSLQRLEAELPHNAAAAVLAEQRRWQEYHDFACSFPYEFVNGAWRSSGVARCMLREAQARALRLSSYIDLLEAGGFQPPERSVAD